MHVPPIAIVGQGCVLPGALTPTQLWDLVSSRRSALAPVPAGTWQVGPNADTRKLKEETLTDVGGHVLGFQNAFNPEGFLVPASAVRPLDPLVLWTLHAAREAMRSAGMDLGRTTRGGVILGNLSYPSTSLTKLAVDGWKDGPGHSSVDPRNRFMSGFPAHFVAQALGLQGCSFALDAACSSSLYAIKLACDRLHDGSADVMLAGGVNHADDLFLHVGFTALKALSPTGQSRPFHKHADGLVPAHGAGMVVLKRLADAETAGDKILGVIRGVGLSNDGRGRSLLTPSQEGQVRAMRAAYEVSGLKPADISLVECHATGTSVGDEIEVMGMQEVFTGVKDMPVGSLKSNVGHLITASGVSGLLKVLAAMAHKTRPATLFADEPIDCLRSGNVRILHQAEPWECQGLRRAAVNNFGFGGNNAHLLVEEYEGKSRVTVAVQAPEADPETAPPSAPSEEIAIVAQAVVAGPAGSAAEFAASFLTNQSQLKGEHPAAMAEPFDLDVGKLVFSPNDLKETLPQQLLLMKAAADLGDALTALPKDRAGLIVGMQTDAEVARYGVRWRFPAPAGGTGPTGPGTGTVTAAGVLGSMPNMVANRLSHQLEFKGPCYSVSGEEASGTVALDLAVRMLRQREVDSAVVGAVDLSAEPIHRAAANAVLGEDRRTPGDAAVLMVLKRLEDARKAGDQVLAIVTDNESLPVGVHLGPAPGSRNLAPLFGHAHAASGLLHVAAAATACSTKTLPGEQGRSAMPWLPTARQRVARVDVATVTGQTTRTLLRSDMASRGVHSLVDPTPRLAVYSGPSMDALMRAVARGDESDDGELRLAIVGRGEAEFQKRLARAQELLARATSRDALKELDTGIYFGDRRQEGETAFVFTGPVGSYAQMGRDLALALPELVDDLGVRFSALRKIVGWIYESNPHYVPGVAEKMWGASFMCQLHAAVSRGILDIKPQASIGYCSGETNALFALDAWGDLDGLHQGIADCELFEREMGGDLNCARRAWGVPTGSAVHWQSWRVRATIPELKAAMAGEPRVHMTMINAADDIIIAGDNDGCERVAAKLGGRRGRPLEYALVVHAPEFSEFQAQWRKLHTRPTNPVPGVRFYTHATCSTYTVNQQNVADAITGQASVMVDFPRLIEKAYADGVRVFIEHGPQAGCTTWIKSILGNREHVAVPLDRYGRSSLLQVVLATARMVTAGVKVNHRALMQHLAKPAPRVAAASAPSAKKRSFIMRFPSHWEPVRFPAEQAVAAAPAAPRPAPAARPVVSTPVPPRSVAVPVPVAAPALPAPMPLAASPVLPAPVLEMPVSRPTFQASHPLAAHHAQLAELHTAFLRQQVEAQGRFTQLLMNTLPGGVVTVPASLVPAPVAAAVPPPPAPVVVAPPPAPAPVVAKKVDVAPPPPAPVKAEEPRRIITPAEAAKSGPVKGMMDIWKRNAPAPIPQGPTWGRDGLLVHSSGNISEIFGPLFKQQDGYEKVVRMPEPPMLLADRVTGVVGEPGGMKTGTIWTETDVRADAWYLHNGRMPAGIMVESGQADLMLISYLGVDFLNKGKRVYRLLGCDLKSYGALPKPGDTLCYDIHVDGHANQGDVRLFFFHYDCRINGEIRMSVRGGQAGFFTRDELDHSAGVLWTPEEGKRTANPRLDKATVTTRKTRLSYEELTALEQGRAAECFGAGFERLDTHTATPNIQGGKMRFLDTVTNFEPQGGPWKRGYLRATQALKPDHWFMVGHFKNDPCMPGTLMFEGGLQAMALYMMGMGCTVERDGWRFEPVDEQAYNLRCRGQAVPGCKEVVYEVFVDEFIDGPTPMLFADVLGTVDGLKAFHVPRMGLRLVPSWPLEPGRMKVEIPPEPKPVATAKGVELGYKSLLACAWGKPSDAFGEMYKQFDGHRKVARLPGPPYHFMSRINRVEGEMGAMKAGSVAEVEYDVPRDAWYFKENGCPVMPYAVLLEVALQPCGWLASFVGCAASRTEDLVFRNLDGTGTIHREVTPDTGTITTTTKLKSISQAGGLILVGFDVTVKAGGQVVYTLDTGFGFFPLDAMRNQVGIPATDAERARLKEPENKRIELKDEPAHLFKGAPRLAGKMLLMIDRVTGLWPTGGKKGLGRIRTEKDVKASDWSFKAHFFTDPVQPGSLGLEAMLQAVQVLMLENGLAKGIPNARFEPVANGVALTWKYRGQVVPENAKVHTDMEIVEIKKDEHGLLAVTEGSLWVDGKQIYQARGMGMRIVSGDAKRA